MFKHHEKKKYLHTWMSFSSNEADLLKSYLDNKAKEGYEVRKIARYYIRFKHTTDDIPPFYVQSYRRHFLGHLYWKFSHEPFETEVKEKSRLKFNALMLAFLALSFLLSIHCLVHFNYRLLYSDGFFALILMMPFFVASFFLDYVGRFWESYRPSHHGYQFAHFRALYLSINMFLRYLLWFGIVLPLFLKELRIQVVFIILFVSIYELAYYYLPHRFKIRLVMTSGILSLLICVILNQVQLSLPYQKAKVDYSSFHMLRLENMINQEQFDESLNYKRQVHRYTSTSLMIPLYYYREEIMRPIIPSDINYQISVSFSSCVNEEIAKYVFEEKIKSGEMLDAMQWRVDEIYQINPAHLVIRLKDTVFEFKGTFDLNNPQMMTEIQKIVEDNIKFLKKN